MQASRNRSARPCMISKPGLPQVCSRHVLQSRRQAPPLTFSIQQSHCSTIICTATYFILILYSPDIPQVWSGNSLVSCLTSLVANTLYANAHRLVATLGANSNLKKIRRKAILNVDVPKACETIIAPEVPMALRLQSSLLLVQHCMNYTSRLRKV